MSKGGGQEPLQLEAKRLESLVSENPIDVETRLALAVCLRRLGRHADALEQCTAILSITPDHQEALREAARAAEALGDTERAAGFRRLSEALAVAVPVTGEPEAPVVPLRAVEDVETSSVKLTDVAGLDHVKQRLRTAFLGPLANPEMRQMYAKSLRGGLLLWGPPGCGKTFLARATAGELGARFIGIALHDVVEMWYGQSEQNLHALFEQARANAPCVLFVDEVDALGRKRSQLRWSPGREVVVQFLAELDGLQGDNEGIFVLAATNHPWDVDTALRRPGRFDRVLLVLPPDEDAREHILHFHLRGRPLGEVNLKGIAQRTDLFSGADLAHLCETATEYALADSVESGQARPIEMSDFERGLSEIEPSTLPWLKTARNYAEFAGEGGTYDELLAFIEAKSL